MINNDILLVADPSPEYEEVPVFWMTSQMKAEGVSLVVGIGHVVEHRRMSARHNNNSNIIIGDQVEAAQEL